jgi:hypothetical protein
MTKGEVLRYAIAFALRRSRKIIRGLKEGLTEEERYAVADHTVAQFAHSDDRAQSFRRIATTWSNRSRPVWGLWTGAVRCICNLSLAVRGQAASEGG